MSDSDFVVSKYPKRTRRNVTVLTPDIINEINLDYEYSVTSGTEDGETIKKRRLIGPKSKTKNAIYNPPSLLQCALYRINENICPELNYNPYLNAEVEKQNHVELFYPSEIKHTYSLFNPFVPTECNYCMKPFDNSIELAKHETVHLHVGVGPRVGEKAYMRKYRHYYKLYTESCLRKRQQEFLQQVELKNTNDQTGEYDDEQDYASSLLVPTSTQVDHVFEVINNEVTVNGKPLKDYDKIERRSLYKTIHLDGVKRKFCPICRHTFKDNWAIDIHYLNSSCQFTCKYCGLKFKFHQDLFPEHLKTHEGEPCNKIFGPSDRRTKFKRRVLKLNRFGKINPVPHSTTSIIPPRVKPIKIKNLLQRKAAANLVKIKSEPGMSGVRSRTNEVAEKPTGIQPYQAYFCRKCFKVFFKIDEFNTHTSKCKGASSSDNDSEVIATSELSRMSESSTPEPQVATSKRPTRSCVRDISVMNDSDTDSIPGNWSPKLHSAGGYECGICSSSFPSRNSRNSHMRIHKEQTQMITPEKTNYIPQQPQQAITATKPDQHNLKVNEANSDSRISNIRLANLNPTVARLVQNNPHLTIRSYTKATNPQDQKIPVQHIPKKLFVRESLVTEPPIKRAYRCGDCNDRFENKSLLYYHKMQNCIVKRHYECGFCRKKFGSQEHYNTHMLYVHPE